MKYPRFSLFVLSVLLTSICNPAFAASSSPPLIITEVGAYEKSGTDALEWVEVYNRSNEPVDITNWKFLESSGANLLSHGISATSDGTKQIMPGSYAVIAQNDANLKVQYPALAVPVFDSSWSTLSLDGEIIGLKDSLDTSYPFTYPASSKTSLEKIDLLLDDSTESNWRVSPYINSIGQANNSTATSTTEVMPITEPPVDLVISTTSTPDVASTEIPVIPLVETTTVASTSTPEIITVNTATSSTIPVPETQPVVLDTSSDVHPALLQPSPLRISELVPNPDNEPEWIEIYNHSSNAYDASACYLKDKTGKEQLHDILAPESYAVIEVKNITLNNTGDEISIVCNDGIVDAVLYGAVEGSEKQLSAPVPKKGQALIRKVEMAATSAELFGVGVPTKGLANTIPVVPQTTTNVSTVSSEPTTPVAIDVVINEVFTQSSGNDSQTEFIELYNRGDFTTDLRGWKITDGSVQYTIKDSNELRFPPGAYYVINRTSSTLALSSKGTITLKDPNLQLVDETKFADVEVDTSWSRFGNDWSLTSLVTKGVDNTMKRPNHAPIARLSSVKNATVGASLLLSSEDSTDQDGDTLQYLWDFGDGTQSHEANPTHVFTQSGSYPVLLTVQDGQRQATVQQNVTIAKPFTISTAPSKPTTSKRTKSTIVSYQYNPVDLDTLTDLPNNTPVIVEGTIHYINKNSRIRSFYLGNPGIEVQLGSVVAEYLKLNDSVKVRALVSVSSTGVRVLKVKDLTVIPALPPIVPATLSLSDAGLHETDYVEVTGVVSAMKGRDITLTDDTGTCKVTLPSTSATLKIGDTITVKGSSLKSSSACKIFVTNPESVSVDFSVATNSKLSAYVPVTATGVGSVALAALWKKKSSLLTFITNIWKRNTIA